LSNFLVRTLTGFFLVLVIIGAVLFSSLSYFILFSVVILAGMLEFYSLARRLKIRAQQFAGIVTGLLFFLVNFLYAMEYIHVKFFYVFIPLALLVFINELFLNNRRPFSDIAFTFLGIFYVALPVSVFNYLVFHTGIEVDPELQTRALAEPINSLLQPSREVDYSPGILLGYFILLWMYDTGAYLIGTPFGRRKLMPRISPRKTWEGLVGGTVVALVTAWPVSLVFEDIALHQWWMIALIIVVTGTLGDLVESMYKRSAGVKDSGSILPGHGGVLDRFDAVLLSVPVVFAYLNLVN